MFTDSGFQSDLFAAERAWPLHRGHRRHEFGAVRTFDPAAVPPGGEFGAVSALRADEKEIPGCICGRNRLSISSRSRFRLRDERRGPAYLDVLPALRADGFPVFPLVLSFQFDLTAGTVERKGHNDLHGLRSALHDTGAAPPAPVDSSCINRCQAARPRAASRSDGVRPTMR